MTHTAWPEPLTEATHAATADARHPDGSPVPHIAHQPHRFGGPAAQIAEWGTGTNPTADYATARIGLSQRVACAVATGRSVSPGAAPTKAAVYGTPPREVALLLDPLSRLQTYLRDIGANAAASAAVLVVPMLFIVWAASGLWNSGQIDTEPTVASVPSVPTTPLEQTAFKVGTDLGVVPAQPAPLPQR